ncbi:MAG TPA: FAD:protein FMN transferase [Verrucomicrobiae bacterium]|nr:FAD:protein FMN transferase [Verrucomicrobiae bacterium]
MRGAVLLAVAALASAAAPAGRPVTAERARFLMGTTCRVEAAHTTRDLATRAADDALDEIARWESILSDYDPASELSRLNARGSSEAVPCSRELFGFLETSAGMSRETGGAFDITVGPLVDAYALRSGGRWPASREIAAARARTGSQKLALDPAGATARFLAVGMKLDPGAIGKGYALDAAARILERRGVAWGLIDFGGQISVVGAGLDGCGVEIAVASLGRDEPATRTLWLSGGSASTSGNDERGLIVGGRPLGHILDPRTGLPAAGAISVTVVAKSATVADALSTALFVLGPGRGEAVARRFGAEALFTVSADGGGTRALATPGFERLARTTCAPGPPAPGASIR